MRFERLALERYGVFEGAALDFGGALPGFHVVYGPNEAGKSTVLAAIADLLFGIPHRSAYNFRHDNNRLRIAAEIVNAAGQRLAFRRRKANSGTLLSLGAGETALPDNVLAPFLGGMSRDGFTRMFGLDHGRLRAGGEGMLRSGGDLARSLFEAGSGLSGVSAALQAIESDLEAIGNLERRASKTKPLFSAIEGYTEAVQSVRRDGLKADEWRRAEDILAEARTERERLDLALSRLRQRRAGLERLRRAAPILAVVDTLAAEISALGDLPALPVGFAEEWRGLERRHRDLRLLLQAAEETAQRRAADLARTPEPAAILRHAGAVSAAYAQLGRYRKDVADEPKLLRDIANDEALIRAKLDALGCAVEPASVGRLVPPQTREVRIRTLMLQGESAEAAAHAAAGELAKARAAHAQAGALLAALPEGADPTASAAFADEAARLGDVAARELRAARDVERIERDLAEALGRLGGWSGTAQALAARAFPDGDTVRAHDEELRAAQDALLSANRTIGSLDEESRRVDADLAGLKAAGEVPSPAAVRAARDLRDRRWRVVRARHIEHREPSADDRSAFGDTADLAASFESALRDADELVDRRESEAHRVAHFSRLTAEQTRLTNQRRAADAASSAARTALEVADRRWGALWSESGVTPGAPSAMRAWLARKDEAVRQVATLRQAQADRESAEADVALARDLLSRAAQALGAVQDAEATLSDLERFVRAALADARRAWQERQAAARALADVGERLRGQEAAASATREAVASWTSDWAEAVTALGLPAGSGRAEAELALAAWGEIRQRLVNKEQTARRLEGIRRDNEAFVGGLARLVAGLGSEAADLAPAGDPLGTIEALDARLGRAREAAARHSTAAEDHRTAIAALDAARLAAHAAGEACGAFRQAYGLAAETDVPAFAERAETRRRLVAALAERRTALLAASDGANEATIRAELMEAAPDAAAAELALLLAEEARLVEQGQAAAQAETSARYALDALAGREGVAAAAQRAKHHAGAVAMHLERWLQLSAAKRILERALERYRTENQHPLVRRGGEIFAALAATGENPIIRLDVVYGDGTDPALVGLRRDGSECQVEGMSEGTRDQLYLALRIAAVEQYVAENEPMPFIADDLFITSDEDRVAAGLAALVELGRSTQVILFTHHQHVARLASLLPSDAVRLHRWPPPRALAHEQAGPETLAV